MQPVGRTSAAMGVTPVSLSALIKLDSENRYILFLDSKEDLETLPPGAEVRLVQPRQHRRQSPASSNDTAPSRTCGAWRVPCPRQIWMCYCFRRSIVTYRCLAVQKRSRMIHDIIAERYPDLTLPKRSARWFWKTKVALGRWQADALTTVSEYSRRGIVEQFGIDADRVHVVGEASDPVFRVIDDARLTPHLASLGLKVDSRIVVYVGGFSPHKNLEALIGTFAKLSRSPSFCCGWCWWQNKKSLLRYVDKMKAD